MSNFVEEIIDKAIINKWCVMPDCTTCGASKFKANLVIAASKKTDLDFREKIQLAEDDKEYIAPAFHHLNDQEKSKIILVIIKEITDLSKRALMRHLSKTKDPYELIIDQIRYSGGDNFSKLKYFSVGTPFDRFILASFS